MTTISYISAASANGTSLSMPTHAVGDLLFFAAYRDASTTSPTIPAGWFPVVSGTGGGTNAMSIAFKIATTAAETSGTWTNATHVACAVYRGTSIINIGGYKHTGNTTTLTVSWGQLTTTSTDPIARQNGNTWYVGVLGYKTNDIDGEVAPSGMTNRTNTKGASTGQISIHDTNGDTLWTTTGQTYSTGTAANSRTLIVEIVDTGYTPAASGGGGGRSAIQALSIPGVAIF